MSMLLADWRTTWPEDRLKRWAIVTVYAFAFLAPISISLGQLALLVMFGVAVIFVVRHWREVLGHPLPALVIGLSLFYMVYVIARGVFGAVFEHPNLVPTQWAEVETWFKSLTVPIVIIGLVLAATGNWRKHALGAVLTLLAGYLLYFILEADFVQQFEALRSSARANFALGYREGAITFPALIIFLAIFIPYWVSRATENSREALIQWVIAGALTLLMLLLFVGLLGSKSRNGMLTLLVGLAVMVPVAAWTWRHEIFPVGRRTLLSLLVLAIGVGGVLSQSWDILDQRWQQAEDEIIKVIEMPTQGRGIESVPRGSVGTRVAYWVFGWERFQERPWAGYGPVDPRYLTDKYPVPSQIKNRGDTFHNAHLEILLRFGLIGYLPLALTLLVLLNEARRHLGGPGNAQILGVWGIAFIAMLMVWGMSTHVIHRFPLEFLYGLALGPLAAGLFARNLNSSSGKEGERDG